MSTIAGRHARRRLDKATGSQAARRLHVVWIAAALLPVVASVAVYLHLTLRANDGQLIYALDDAYIHMAMARNLAEHGVLGVTPHAFTSASSSILWTLMLAGGFAVGGDDPWLPLNLNLLFAITAWVVMFQWLRSIGMRAAAIVAILTVAALATPMLSLVFSGMEHTAHLCAAVVFMVAFYRQLVDSHLHCNLADSCPLPSGRGSDGVGAPDNADARSGSMVPLCIASGAMTALRYEGLFLVATAALALWVYRRRRVAVAIVAAGLVAPAVVAIVSVSYGWPALPTSILLKGNMPELNSLAGIADALGFRALRQLAYTPSLAALLLLAVYLLMRGRGHSQDSDHHAVVVRSVLNTLLLVYLGTVMLHLQFAGIGWFMRYEAYLVCMGVLLTGVIFARQVNRPIIRRPIRVMHVAAVLIIAVPLVVRGGKAFAQTVTATHNIYMQQCQTARFLESHYPGASVALNDVGAPAYLADIRLLDLWGLASLDVARARRDGTLDRAALTQLADQHDVQIAVLYDRFYKRIIPTGWAAVATWRIPDNVVCADDRVTFYGSTPQACVRLRAAMEAFAPTLPHHVVVTFHEP